MTDQAYLFVDAAYLRKVVEEIRGHLGCPFALSFQELFRGFEKIFYYDCPPSRRKGETDAEFHDRRTQYEDEIHKISFLDGCHVNEGVIAGKEGRARQKGVDVKLAVDMLMHAMARNAYHFTLLSGDRDFLPLVEAVVNSGRRMHVWAAIKSANQELLAAADVRSIITATQLAAKYVAIAPGERRLQYRHSTQDKHPADLYGDHLIWSSTSDRSRAAYHVIHTIYSGTEMIYAIIHTQGNRRCQSWHHQDYEYLRAIVAYDTDISLPDSASLPARTRSESGA